jgi:uncharacterized membrane protein
VASLFLPIALLTSGIVAGVLLGGEMGIVPFFMTLPAERYVQAHSFVAGRYDPFQPICLLIAAICDAVLVATAPVTAARVVCAAGIVVALSVAAVSRSRTAPMGRWLKTLNPDRLPADFKSEEFRQRWGWWNRTRTGLALLTLLCNVVAAALLL